MPLSQSDKLFAALLIAFVIYVTVKGELPQYFGLFKSNNPPPSSQSSGGGSNNPFGGTGNTANQLAQGAQLLSTIGSFFGF